MQKPKVVDVLLVVLAIAAVGIAGMSYLNRARNSPPALPNLAEISRQLVGRRLQSLPVPADRSTGSALVLVFRPTCPACERNANNWEQLTQGVIGKREIIAISAQSQDSSLTWLRDHRVRFDSLLTPGNADVSSWQFPGVPLTLVVDRTATISYAKLGIVLPTDRSSIHEALGLQTP